MRPNGRERIREVLVLTRKKNEKIVIGNHIEVVVVDIRGEKVRLGISAPKEVTVHRAEVFNAIKREQGHAAGSP
jgi:carbon storage regulator